MNEPIPFTVIGGFLGAGKTTLLNHLLLNTQGTRYAVLVNDFGAINIDQSLVTRHAGQTLSLANGCICCSLANGFVKTMLQLMRHPEAIDHIVVEASGVSNPQRIMDFARLDPSLREDAIIVLIDALNLPDQLADHLIEDTLVRQIGSADLLLLNKTDQVDKTKLDSIESLLHEYNAAAPVVPTRYSQLPLELLLDATPRPGSVRSESAGHEHAEAVFRSLAFRSDHAIDDAAFARFADGLPASILRGKAVLRLTSGSYQWHRVATRNRLTRVKDDYGASEIVLIGYAKDSALDDLRDRALTDLFDREIDLPA